MKNKYLYEALPFLKDIDKERQSQFEEYFETAPKWLLDAFQIEELKKGTVFIREDSIADTIYFVGQGLIEATDYRYYGMAYDYAEFNRMYAFGGMEFIMNLDRYKTTLRTATDCIIVKVSREIFAKWMHSDMRALKLEAKLVAEYLLRQARKERVFLLMQGNDRLAWLFVKRYEQSSENGCLYMKNERQTLADATGLCIKSITRGLKKFESQGLISRKGNKIIINQQQYEKLKENVSSKVDIE
jgi:CRP/FNR family cyclic AMP-dependent transcriptional regulator